MAVYDTKHQTQTLGSLFQMKNFTTQSLAASLIEAESFSPEQRIIWEVIPRKKRVPVLLHLFNQHLLYPTSSLEKQKRNFFRIQSLLEQLSRMKIALLILSAIKEFANSADSKQIITLIQFLFKNLAVDGDTLISCLSQCLLDALEQSWQLKLAEKHITLCFR